MALVRAQIYGWNNSSPVPPKTFPTNKRRTPVLRPCIFGEEKMEKAATSYVLYSFGRGAKTRLK